MTDEQIIKALECCIAQENCEKVSCEICPYDRVYDCKEVMLQNTLDLINRQKAEIERLKRKNAILSRNADTAFQDGLDENRELFKKEVEAEIKSEAIKEFADEINKLFTRYSHLYDHAENASRDIIDAADGTDIEMQSVWDVFTLKENEMAEYDEMCRLQNNIETIAKARLLSELEKDVKLLVKEMTEVQE